MTLPVSPSPVSAYIPCYNCASTLAASIESLRQQTVPIDDLFVVDDGSTDQSREVARQHQVRLVEMKTNQGRGAARARAMVESRHEIIVCCDATNRLRPDFLAQALPRFSDPIIAAVQGRLIDPQIRGVVSRWRARHLFRQEETIPAALQDALNTWGTVLRKEPALQVGNYDFRLRHSEDADLGKRLAAAGYKIFFEPAAIGESQVQNTLSQVMERYVRWNHGEDTDLWKSFLEAQVVALKILAPRDLRQRDPAAAVLSCLMPYYQLFWSSRLRKASPP